LVSVSRLAEYRTLKLTLVGISPAMAEGADASWNCRRSFCCAVEGCRRRSTPPSVRFLGRKVYVGAVVVLATALQHGPSKKSVTALPTLLGITRRTLVRWRRWWSTAFARSRFWTSLRDRFVPAVDGAAMPASLLSRMLATDDAERLIALLRVLAPVTTRPGLEASAM
jgi:hypothetical protein